MPILVGGLGGCDRCDVEVDARHIVSRLGEQQRNHVAVPAPELQHAEPTIEAAAAMLERVEEKAGFLPMAVYVESNMIQERESLMRAARAQRSAARGARLGGG